MDRMFKCRGRQEAGSDRTHQKYGALLAYRKRCALLTDASEPAMQDE
jgi:hypothetical protein